MKILLTITIVRTKTLKVQSAAQVGFNHLMPAVFYSREIGIYKMSFRTNVKNLVYGFSGVTLTRNDIEIRNSIEIKGPLKAVLKKIEFLL